MMQLLNVYVNYHIMLMVYIYVSIIHDWWLSHSTHWDVTFTLYSYFKQIKRFIVANNELIQVVRVLVPLAHAYEENSVKREERESIQALKIHFSWNSNS
jgi:hypothetical protein